MRRIVRCRWLWCSCRWVRFTLLRLIRLRCGLIGFVLLLRRIVRLVVLCFPLVCGVGLGMSGLSRRACVLRLVWAWWGRRRVVLLRFVVRVWLRRRRCSVLVSVRRLWLSRRVVRIRCCGRIEGWFWYAYGFLFLLFVCFSLVSGFCGH